MASFDWGKTPLVAARPMVMSSEESDITSDLQTEVEPSDQKWLEENPQKLQEIARQERQAASERPQEPKMDLDLSGADDYGLTDPEDYEQMSDVEYRLEKAQCYKLLINHNLLNSDAPPAVEVEREVQDFIRQKMAELMGISAPQQLSEFEPDEVAALKALAAKVLHRAPPAQMPTSVTPAAIKQPQPLAVRPVEVRRPRGRPRKNPCPICGEMICICKKLPQPVTTGTVEHKGPPVKLASQGKPTEPWIETQPDGTRIKHVGNRHFKLVPRPFLKKDGTTAIEDVEVELLKPQVGPTPWPTEHQIAIKAQAEADANLGAAGPLVKQAVDVWMQTPHRTPTQEE
jgi:hypothetical protein